jgi:hypothetical protein
MKKPRLFLVVALALAILPATAGEGEAEGAQGMTPEMMEMWAKVATPNEHHAHLARMAGTWNVHGKFWMQPGAPPTESGGMAQNQMILGGRFLQTEYTGDFMGESFVGMGLDGYDNLLEKHVGMWVDSAGTMMMQFVGECSEAGKVLKTKSEFLNPMNGEMTTMKGAITVVDDDKYTYESWNEGPDGEFYKSMEITYTRKKS